MSNHRSPISGTEPPRDHRFGAEYANPSGDQKTAAIAHAAKNRAIEVLSRAINSNKTEFETILNDASTPYVVKKLLESFYGDGPLSSNGVRALLALWQTVFVPSKQIGSKHDSQIINDDAQYKGDTVLIRLPKYASGHEHDPLPGYVIDPRNGHPMIVLQEPDDPYSGNITTMPMADR